MTLRMPHDQAGLWRPACPADLGAIVRMAATIHPDYPERPETFASRLRLHPAGVMLATIGDIAAGYAIGHPWRGPPPLLDTVLERLPDAPDSFWLHDVALLETARGRRLGGAALALLQAEAERLGLTCLRLIAVGSARPFWETNGFAATGEPVPDCYGSGAVNMRRQIAPTHPPKRA